MKPKANIYKVERDVLEGLLLPEGSNLVIVKITAKAEDDKTESGIIKVGDQDFKPANHAERWGYVYKLPDKLTFKKGALHGMPWETEIECAVGDMVWFDMRSALYAYTMECDGDWYKVMHYSQLYVAYNDDVGFIPLNGYVMMREVMKEKSSLEVDEKVDKRLAEVVYFGRPNKQYIEDYWDDEISILFGDRVLFEDGTSYFYLDNTIHKHDVLEDQDFILQQRKRFLLAIDGNGEVADMHKGVIGVVEIKEDLDRGNVKLLSSQERYRLVGVVESKNDSIPVGSKLLVSKKEGVLWEGVEYMMLDNVLYYEENNKVDKDSL